MSPLLRRLGLALLAALVSTVVAGGALRLWRRSRPPHLVPDDGAFTIFVVGGSSAFGEPYHPRSDLGQISAHLLGGSVRGRIIRVRLVGGSGRSAASALGELDAAVGGRRRTGTAIAFLYLGNNEFLEYDTAHDLSMGPRPLFDTPTLDARSRERVLVAYERTIDSILERLRTSNVPVVASTAAVNLKDWEPNRTVLADAGHAPRLRSLLLDGETLLARGEIVAARARLEEAVALEPGAALAQYRLATAALAQNDLAAARTAFQLAIDLDGNPTREISGQTRRLLASCRRHGVPVVDAAALLQTRSPQGIVGDELMWDNCHPVLAGYAEIALAFTAETERILGVQRARHAFGPGELEAVLGIDESFLGGIYLGRAQYVYVASTLVPDPGPRLKRARRYLDAAALRLGDHDLGVVTARAVLEALAGDARRSVSLFREAYELDPMATRERLRNPRVTGALRRLGVLDAEAAVTAPQDRREPGSLR